MTKRIVLGVLGTVYLAALLLLIPKVRARAQSIAGQYLTNGQVLIGSTGLAPVAGTISGTGITVTVGAGTIALSITAGAIDTTKLGLAAVDTTKLDLNANAAGALCELGDANHRIGHCSNASAVTCTCQ